MLTNQVFTILLFKFKLDNIQHSQGITFTDICHYFMRNVSTKNIDWQIHHLQGNMYNK